MGAATVFLVAACSDPVDPGPPPAFSRTPAAQWSGGSLTLRSPFLVGLTSLPIITAAADTLTLSRVDDSTVTTTLPEGPSGSVTLRLARGTRFDSVASVQRVGFREKRTALPALAGELLVADSGGHPLVYGNTDAPVEWGAPLGRIDLAAAAGQTVTGVRGPSNVVYGLSPSLPVGTFVVRDATDSVKLFRLLPPPAAPVRPVPGVGTSFVRQVAQLSAGMWLFTGSHMSYTRAEADSPNVHRITITAESPWAVFLSPRSDRTTLATTVTGPQPGVPVFDNVTGDTAFSLPLLGTEGAAFSPDGGIIYAVGGADYSADTLVAVDATTGQTLSGKMGLPPGYVGFSIAFTSSGGGRLLVGAATASSLALLVYDATTLTLLGVLPSGDTCGPYPMTGECSYGVVAVDESLHLAYIVVPGSPTPVRSFDLLPNP